ncbi:hypothetical protein CTRI78_v011472 [Colletotrichum trifolii]|uniref:Uncharacterized protein n=1 Tax=Colletotrichum trifolii TaxID=5466 RepID=A0A4R8QF33_COLTR|nr:hypothetical protein CTRI78_v011472 [Colletotrichum trifolii]
MGTLPSSSVPEAVRKKTWETALDPAASSATSERVTRVHEAWAIKWAASDTASPTSKLPALTSSMKVPSTGHRDKRCAMANTTKYRRASSSRYFDDGFLYSLIIGMPIIGALMMAACVWCCVRKCKKEAA